MIFNEFVLTSKSFIRTVTTVKPEWYVLSFQMHIQTSDVLWRSRLLEYGGDYFDLKTFPDGEAKTALQRIVNRRMGKRFDEEPGPAGDRKKKKKRRMDKEPTSGPASSHELTSGPALGQEPVSGPAANRGPTSDH